MGTTRKTESPARQSFNLGILSWAILSIVSITGFLMERFAYGTMDEPAIFQVLFLLVLMLLVNFILSMRGFILGVRFIRNMKEGEDRAMKRTAAIGTLLGVIGAVISGFIFLTG